MEKYFKSSRLSSVVPEVIALLIVFNTTEITALVYIFPLLAIYSFILRFIWQSAIIIHGLGHTIAIALSDLDFSAINLTNILEQQSILQIFKSLIPYPAMTVSEID